jgi:hypothetical protein
MKRFALLCLVLAAAFAFGQNPATTNPLDPLNAKWVQGTGPGYAPSKGSGLTLNIAPGTANCAGTKITYAGGTLTMTASATNYVYLDTTASCAPAANTGGYPSSGIFLATVVAGSSSITSITDDRTFFFAGGGGGTYTAANPLNLTGSVFGLKEGAGVGNDGSGNLTTVGHQPGEIAPGPACPLGCSDGQVIALAPLSFAVTVPSGCTHSYMGAQTAPTNSVTFTFYQLAGGPTGTATAFATATFSALSNTATFTCSSSQPFAEGDWLEIVGPTPHDPTLASIGAGVYVTR